MKILLTGGGTIGSVSPLLAIISKLKEKGIKTDSLFLGSYHGAEKELVKNHNISYQPIFSGKLRRYFSFKNFIDPIFIFLGFIQSFFIILKFKPDVIISAGSFTSVPVVWAGWIFKIPSLAHQQDVTAGLANKLMAKAAVKITVTFEKSLKDFPENKAVWTGNPSRFNLAHKDSEDTKRKARAFFHLENNLPVILVIGGGTGALSLNKLIIKGLLELTKFYQIIHLTGKDKNPLSKIHYPSSNYHPYEFLTKEMLGAFLVADLIICRAGMGTLTEISLLGKPAIIIPMPLSHQEKNAEIFVEKNAALVLNEINLTPEILTEQIKNLLNDKTGRENFSKNVRNVIKGGGEEKIAEEILNLLA